MRSLGNNWKLEAVRQVRLLMGRGYRRFAAQQDIAAQLGFTMNDLITWERELVQNPDWENELFCSELAGEYLDRLLSGHPTNIPNYKAFGAYAKRYNIERAADIAKSSKRHSIRDIRSALRGAHRA
ncbi:hypothetical protein [Devosia nitrariae]|uniref:Uncharacterized protein n=1 Tax=Devosia nitrariae TaxID=2071872 RepID=A0ABQ5WDH3_9HYPH|nr:hypothetical protein [Devosia nitrariae]GLQ57933.1 hypothetical protein GCM10010862_51920 [Devosia nitrariae]